MGVNAKTNFERSKTRLSFSDIKNVKESGGITTALPKSLLTRHGFHIDQHGLTKPGVPAVKGRVETTTAGREFVV